MPTTVEPGPHLPRGPLTDPAPTARSDGAPKRGPRGMSFFKLAVIFALLAGLSFAWIKRYRASHPTEQTGPGSRMALANLPVPIVAGVVEKRDVPIYLDGLGTVQAFNTVTVRSRVDGQIQRIAFTEGQDVHAGDLLALIDPAPFQAQLDQYAAKKLQDEAQLAIAKQTLARDAELLASKILSQQEYDTQKAQVDQFAAAVKADQALIDNAQTQLAYATITSPLDGRTGIRQVDQGNIVHANDATGLVVIAQLHPISVVFTLPEQTLRLIQARRMSGETLAAIALDRDNLTPLGEGKLAVIDNQIDTTTGTIRLKATFPNDDLKLWPGQFVNVRLHLETRLNCAVVPASVVQRGPDGAFAFVIGKDLTAQVRPIKVDQIEQGLALVTDGLAPGEQVVVDGQYKLQAGSKVKLPDPGPKPVKPSGSPARGNNAS
jgi:multidrug efflux system membrane fusion protein